MNKISINAWESIAERIDDTFEADLFGNHLAGKIRLSMDESIAFVNGCVNSCFDKDTGVYMAEVKDFVVKSNTIEFYTNINLPKDLKKRYELIYKTWDIIGDIIFKNIDCTQYDEMANAVESKINYILRENADIAYAKINESISSVKEIYEYIQSMFAGVTPEDIDALTNALGKIGNIDDGKILNALIERGIISNGEGIKN